MWVPCSNCFRRSNFRWPPQTILNRFLLRQGADLLRKAQSSSVEIFSCTFRTPRMYEGLCANAVCQTLVRNTNSGCSCDTNSLEFSKTSILNRYAVLVSLRNLSMVGTFIEGIRSRVESLRKMATILSLGSRRSLDRSWRKNATFVEQLATVSVPINRLFDKLTVASGKSSIDFWKC